MGVIVQTQDAIWAEEAGDGTMIYVTVGVPNPALGSLGDLAFGKFDEDTVMYGPKGVDGWGAGTSIRGPEGPEGDPGGGSSGPATAQPFYPEDYGAEGDVVCLADGVTTASSAIVTSASGAFANAAPGMRVSIGNAAAGPGPLHTTVLSKQSSNQITLATTAGVSITGAVMSYGTDDTAAVQDCIDAAADANGTVVLSTMYATTAEITVPAACDVTGTGCYGIFGNYANGLPTGQGPGVPWTPPYVVGAGLHVMASSLRSGMAIPNQATEVHLSKFAIRFAAPFWNTGHGIYAPAGASNNGNGIPNATWSELKVWGVDGGSYAYWLENFFQIKLDSLRYWGGGGYHFRHNNGNWAFGNSQINDCTGKTFVGGSAHPITLEKGGGGPMNQMSFLTPGANSVNPDKYFLSGLFNGRTIPPTTASQKLINAPTANINGLSMVGGTWDNAGQDISTPTLPTTKGPAGGAGLFLDPGGLYISASQFQPMIIGPGYNGGMYNPGNLVREVTTNQTVTSAGDCTYAVDATAGNVTITLPSRSTWRGVAISVVKVDGSANTVTMALAGGDTINGSSSNLVFSTQGAGATVLAGTTGWVKKV